MIARALGVSGRGELTAAVLWPAFLQTLFALGLPEAVTHHVARDPENASRILSTAGRMVMLRGGLLIATAAVLLPLVLQGYPDAVVVGALLIVLTAPAALQAIVISATLNSLGIHARANAIRLIVVAASLALISGLVIVDRLTVFTGSLTYAVGNLVTYICAVRFRRRVPKFQGNAKSRATARRLRAFGIRTSSSTMAAMVNERLDQLLLSLLVSSRDLGLYATAVTATSPVTIVGSTFSYITLPRASTVQTADDHRRVFRRAMFLATTMASVGALPLLLAPEFCLTIVFGPDFASAAELLQILTVAGVVLCISRVTTATLAGTGRPLAAGGADSGALVVTIVGLAVLVPALGVTGAAVASLAAYGASWTISTRSLRKALWTQA